MPYSYLEWAKNIPIEIDIDAKYRHVCYGIKNLPFIDKDAKKVMGRVC